MKNTLLLFNLYFGFLQLLPLCSMTQSGIESFDNTVLNNNSGDFLIFPDEIIRSIIFDLARNDNAKEIYLLSQSCKRFNLILQNLIDQIRKRAIEQLEQNNEGFDDWFYSLSEFFQENIKANLNELSKQYVYTKTYEELQVLPDNYFKRVWINKYYWIKEKCFVLDIPKEFIFLPPFDFEFKKRELEPNKTNIDLKYIDKMYSIATTLNSFFSDLPKEKYDNKCNVDHIKIHSERTANFLIYSSILKEDLRTLNLSDLKLNDEDLELIIEIIKNLGFAKFVDSLCIALNLITELPWNMLCLKNLKKLDCAGTKIAVPKKFIRTNHFRKIEQINF